MSVYILMSEILKIAYKSLVKEYENRRSGSSSGNKKSLVFILIDRRPKRSL